MYSCFYFVFFFFKQKTAYEMRISDWSSDVCSSDLCIAILAALALPAGCTVGPDYVAPDVAVPASYGADAALPTNAGGQTGGWWTGFMEIGRASCRERVCQYG